MPRKQFSKPALSTLDLIAFLQGKGLTINNVVYASNKLNYIGYYRLKIYMRPLELPTKKFKPGTNFDDIVELYEFDRELRLIFLDAIERVEVAVRANIINVMGSFGGPHFYYDESYFENKSAVSDTRNMAKKSKHLSINHYFENYHTPYLPPIWCITEASTFGDTSRLFANLSLIHRKRISRNFSLDEKVMVSWLRSLNTVRNACAHHGRLWNADLLVDTPMIANNYASELTNNKKIYSRAVVIRAILNGIDKQYSDDWVNKLKLFMSVHPNIDLNRMDFPSNWYNRPLWN